MTNIHRFNHNISPHASAADQSDFKHQSDFYKEYINSPQWEKKRKIALRRSGYMCEHKACEETTRLEVHHLTYERLGKERQADLRVLCHTHHVTADKLRAAQRRKRFSSWLIGW